MTGIFLSTIALNSLSHSARGEVLSCLSTTATVTDAPSETGYPRDFSLTQVRKFFERCSPKTRKALREIAKADAQGFNQRQIAKALGVDLGKEDLRGVWGGITKRTRAILGDSTADIIDWEYRDNDWHGRVSPVTHNALRTVLNV